MTYPYPHQERFSDGITAELQVAGRADAASGAEADAAAGLAAQPRADAWPPHTPGRWLAAAAAPDTPPLREPSEERRSAVRKWLKP